MITLMALETQRASNLAIKERFGQLWDHVLDFNLRMAISVMRFRGIESIHAIGNFTKEGIVLPAAGKSIIIPKGLAFKSLRPKADTDVFKADRKIVVASVSMARATGFYEEYHNHPASIQELPFEIKWAGKGNYWCYVTLNDWLEAGGYELTLAFEADHCNKC